MTSKGLNDWSSYLKKQIVIGVPRLSELNTIGQSIESASKERDTWLFVLVCTTMQLIYLCFFVILHQH